MPNPLLRALLCAAASAAFAGACSSSAGDDSPERPDAAPQNDDTSKLCGANQYVAGNACRDCAAGTENPAGDDPALTDTTCSSACQASTVFDMDLAVLASSSLLESSEASAKSEEERSAEEHYIATAAGHLDVDGLTPVYSASAQSVSAHVGAPKWIVLSGADLPTLTSADQSVLESSLDAGLGVVVLTVTQAQGRCLFAKFRGPLPGSPRTDLPAECQQIENASPLLSYYVVARTPGGGYSTLEGPEISEAAEHAALMVSSSELVCSRFASVAEYLAEHAFSARVSASDAAHTLRSDDTFTDLTSLLAVDPNHHGTRTKKYEFCLANPRSVITDSSYHMDDSLGSACLSANTISGGSCQSSIKPSDATEFPCNTGTLIVDDYSYTWVDVPNVIDECASGAACDLHLYDARLTLTNGGITGYSAPLKSDDGLLPIPGEIKGFYYDSHFMGFMPISADADDQQLAFERQCTQGGRSDLYELFGPPPHLADGQQGYKVVSKMNYPVTTDYGQTTVSTGNSSSINFGTEGKLSNTGAELGVSAGYTETASSSQSTNKENLKVLEAAGTAINGSCWWEEAKAVGGWITYRGHGPTDFDRGCYVDLDPFGFQTNSVRSRYKFMMANNTKDRVANHNEVLVYLWYALSSVQNKPIPQFGAAYMCDGRQTPAHLAVRKTMLFDDAAPACDDGTGPNAGFCTMGAGSCLYQLDTETVQSPPSCYWEEMEYCDTTVKTGESAFDADACTRRCRAACQNDDGCIGYSTALEGSEQKGCLNYTRSDCNDRGCAFKTGHGEARDVNNDLRMNSATGSDFWEGCWAKKGPTTKQGSEPDAPATLSCD